MTTKCAEFGGFWYVIIRFSRRLLTDYELILTSMTPSKEPVKVYRENFAV